MTQTNKASAFETFYSFMSKETYDVFVQYIIEVCSLSSMLAAVAGMTGTLR